LAVSLWVEYLLASFKHLTKIPCPFPPPGKSQQQSLNVPQSPVSVFVGELAASGVDVFAAAFPDARGNAVTFQQVHIHV